MTHVDKMFVFGGSPTCVNGSFSNDTWVFDFATLTWQKKAPLDGSKGGARRRHCVRPDDGQGIPARRQELYSYDLAADQYTNLATDDIDYHLTAVIDPVRKRLVLLGGGQAWVYDIGPGSTYIRQALATTGGNTIVNSAYPGLAYDPATDRIVAWNGGDSVYSLNMTTGAWTTTTFAGGPGSAQVERHVQALELFTGVGRVRPCQLDDAERLRLPALVSRRGRHDARCVHVSRRRPGGGQHRDNLERDHRQRDRRGLAGERQWRELQHQRRPVRNDSGLGFQWRPRRACN
jgi:hypothetical protein